MKPKTKKEVKSIRKKLSKSSTVKSVVSKGDKRISSPSRVCSVCGAKLSQMNMTNGKALSKKKHIHMQYSKYLYIDMCFDIMSCYKNLGLEEDD